MKKIGALEAGGTKMVLGVFDEAGQGRARRGKPRRGGVRQAETEQG